MSNKIRCRLCLYLCENSIKLYDENGDCNIQVYEIAVEFFDEKFLTKNEEIEGTLICLRCWKQIFDFHKFHKKILLVQEQLLGKNLNEQISSNLQKNTNFAQEQQVDNNHQQNVSHNSGDTYESEDIEMLIKANVVGGIKKRFISEPKLEIIDINNEASAAETETFVGEHAVHEISSEVDEASFWLENASEDVTFKEEFIADNITIVVDAVHEASREFDANLEEEFITEDFVYLHAEVNEIQNGETAELDCNDTAADSNNAIEMPSYLENNTSVLANDEFADISNDENSNDIESNLQLYDIEGQSDEHEDAVGVFAEREYENIEKSHSETNIISESCQDEMSMHSKSSVVELSSDDDDVVVGESRANNSNLHRSSKKKDDIYFMKSSENHHFIAQWKPMLNCPLCDETCPNFLKLRLHFRRNHRGTKCYIICCQRTFYRPCDLAEHVRIHIDPNSLMCKFCEKTYLTEKGLKAHAVHCPNAPIYSTASTNSIVSTDTTASTSSSSVVNSDNNPALNVDELNATIAIWNPCLNCPLCGLTSPDFMDLSKHFESQHPHELCHVLCCKYKFYTINLLADHARLHLDPTSYKCGICRSCYKTEHAYKKHLYNYHADSELDVIIAAWKSKLVCGTCPESCASFKLLARHFQRNHLEDVPFILCCGKRQKGYTEIGDHALLHADSNYFKCEQCGLCLRNSKHLNYHMHFKHKVPVDKDYPQHGCKICNTYFNTYWKYRTHMSTHKDV